MWAGEQGDGAQPSDNAVVFESGVLIRVGGEARRWAGRVQTEPDGVG